MSELWPQPWNSTVLHPQASLHLPFRYCSLGESWLSGSFLSFLHLTMQVKPQHALQMGFCSFEFLLHGSRILHPVHKRSKYWENHLIFRKPLWNKDIKRGSSCTLKSIFPKNLQHIWASPKPGPWKQWTSRDMEMLVHDKAGKKWQAKQRSCVGRQF